MNKDYQRIKLAIEYLHENFAAQPGLDELSDVIHLSPYHLQRLFKRWAGVTPKQFLACVTLKFTNKSLLNGDTTLDTTMNAGLSSNSRLHDLYVNFHAMSPAQYRNKGQGLRISYGNHESPFGNMIIGITDKGICNLLFSNSEFEIEHESEARNQLQAYWNNAEFIHAPDKTMAIANNIFNHNAPARKFDVHLGGTNFQIKVWQALLQIPFGSVSNYGKIANAINSQGASRAVGSAIGKNPVALLIPCHRVIKSTGVIGEYHWGVERKKAVLAWEQCRLTA